MAAEDFLEPEVALAVAAAATLLSPGLRGLVRRGAVFGLSKLLTVAEALVAAGRAIAPDATARSAPSGLEDIIRKPEPRDEPPQRGMLGEGAKQTRGRSRQRKRNP